MRNRDNPTFGIVGTGDRRSTSLYKTNYPPGSFDFARHDVTHQRRIAACVEASLRRASRITENTAELRFVFNRVLEGAGHQPNEGGMKALRMNATYLYQGKRVKVLEYWAGGRYVVAEQTDDGEVDPKSEKWRVWPEECEEFISSEHHQAPSQESLSCTSIPAPY